MAGHSESTWPRSRLPGQVDLPRVPHARAARETRHRRSGRRFRLRQIQFEPLSAGESEETWTSEPVVIVTHEQVGQRLERFLRP
jgi:hypothetical protein